MTGFAGTMRERVTLLTRAPARDALGAAGEEWVPVEMVWASVVPEGQGALYAGDARDALPLWKVTLRPCAVRVGDRIERVSGTLDVRSVRIDPRQPDRVIAIGEERR